MSLDPSDLYCDESQIAAVAARTNRLDRYMLKVPLQQMLTVPIEAERRFYDNTRVA